MRCKTGFQSNTHGCTRNTRRCYTKAALFPPPMVHSDLPIGW